jgi:signal transduction histidine kinase
MVPFVPGWCRVPLAYLLREVSHLKQKPIVEEIETYAQNIVETVREPLLILDTTLRVRSANRAFCQVFQVSLEETENRLIYELGNGRWDIPDLRTLLEDIVPKSSVFNDFQLEHDFPAIGRRVMLLNARKLQAAHHGELLLLVMEDVTERRRSEADLKAKEMAETANKTKSLFLANMSHELRTPLNAINGFAEFLMDGRSGHLNPKQKEYLDDILNSGRHLLQLINDILDLAKVEANKMDLHPERFSLTKTIEGVCAVAKPITQKKSIKIGIQIANEIGDVVLDQQKFKQILYNLISNAVKFTDKGGRVDICASLLDRCHFKLVVSDTGIGIRAEDISRLFTEFAQLDSGASRRYEGTGLGLALTRKIIELQGGTIGVESEVGKGSAFSVILPLEGGK